MAKNASAEIEVQAFKKHWWGHLKLEPKSTLASIETISASVQLWDTAVCFLQAHKIDTNVCDPTIYRTPLDVDFESVFWRRQNSLQSIA